MKVFGLYSLCVISTLLGSTPEITFVTFIALFCLSALVSRTEMDRQNFNYSLKNIPIPSVKQIQLEFLNSIHNLSSRMKWRAFFYLNPNAVKNDKETFNLNTSKAPPQVKELKTFLDGLCELARNLKFRRFHNPFQKKLKEDLRKIQSENKVIISGDKTRNQYSAEKDDYNNYLHNNITSDYKKADSKIIDDIVKNDKKIATTLEIDDRLHVTSKRSCYITVKDHKPN